MLVCRSREGVNTGGQTGIKPDRPERMIPMATKVILVRHAQTEWNKTNRYQGHLDIPLNEKGLEQARRVALRLSGDDIKAVYTSDLGRALATARAIAEPHGLEPTIVPEFREVDVGKWQGHSMEEAREMDPEFFKLWISNQATTAFPGGESYEDVRRRTMPKLEELVERHQGETLCVVSHAGPLKVMLCSILGMSLDHRRRLDIANASVSVVRYDGGFPRLCVLNDTCHLRM